MMKHPKAFEYGVLTVILAIFMVTAVSLTGCSGASGSDPLRPDQPGQDDRQIQLHPEAPSYLVAYGLDGAIQLDWEPPSAPPCYIFGYNIYRSETTTVPFENQDGGLHLQPEQKVAETGLVKINDEPVTETQYLDTPAVNGTTSYYRIRLVKLGPGGVDEKNHWSNEDYAIASSFLITALEPPSGAPGCIVKAICPDLTKAMGGDVDLEVSINEIRFNPMVISDGYFYFMTPPLKPGNYHIRLHGTGIASNTTPYVIEPIPDLPLTQEEFANNLSEGFISIVQRDSILMTDFNNNSGLYTSDQLSGIIDSLNDIETLFNGVSDLIVQMTPEEANIIQCMLVESGILDLFGDLRSVDSTFGLPIRVANYVSNHPEHIDLFKMDQESAYITNLELKLQAVTYLCHLTALFTGGLSEVVGIPLVLINMGLEVIDYYLDTFFPTDFVDNEYPIDLMLDRDVMSIGSYQGYPELNFVGHFRTQDKFIEATLKLTLGFVLAKVGVSATESLADEVEKYLVTIGLDITKVIGGHITDLVEGEYTVEDHEVDMDIYIYNESYQDLISVLFPSSGAGMYDLLNFFDLEPTSRPSITFDESILEYDFDTERLNAIGLGESNIMVRGYCMRPFTEWWIFSYEAQEWETSDYESIAVKAEESNGWARTWGGAFDDSGKSVAVDNNGNVYVAGDFRGSADFDPSEGNAEIRIASGLNDIFLSKFNSSGAFQWVQTWGGTGDDGGNEVEVDAFGNVYVTGHFTGTLDFDPGPDQDSHLSNGVLDIFLSKFDSSGAFKWARTWGGSSYDRACGLGVDDSGNAYATGYFHSDNVDFDPGPGTDYHSSGGDYDTFLSKFNSGGAFQWAHTWGGSGANYWDNEVAIDSLSNAYVTGEFVGMADFDPGPGTNYRISNGSYDSFLMMFDPFGSIQWVRTWGGTSTDFGTGVEVDALGGVYVAGGFAGVADFDPGTGTDSHTSIGDWDAFATKFDSTGDFQWARTWGGSGQDAGYGIAVDSFGNSGITGKFVGFVDFDPSLGSDPYPSNGGSDVFLSRFDSAGAYQWARTWGGLYGDCGYGIVIDGSNNSYITGFFNGTADFNPGQDQDNHTSNGGLDAFLNKLSASGYW